jgi:hypothetical protein
MNGEQSGEFMAEKQPNKFMTKEQADKLLEEGEDILLNKYGNYISKYAAVIKKESDSDDHYAIEIGFHNIEELELLGGDSEQIRLDSINEIKELFKEKNDNFSGDIDNSNIQFTPIQNIKYHCKDTFGESTERLDKITGGVSVYDSVFRSSSGTAGAFFKIYNDESIYLLSNFHVLLHQSGDICDKIVHPSKAEPGGDSVVIGHIYWKGGIGDLEMDAAIAKITYPVDENKFNRCSIPFLGIDKPKIGDKIKKCGKKTGLSCGEIKSTNCTTKICKIKTKNEYDLYRHQILTTKMSMPGDSGSVIVNSQNKVVGLIYAGDRVNISNAICINEIFRKVTEKHHDFIFKTFV